MSDTQTASADAARLEARVRELEQERKHLLATIEILEEISGSLQFVDILQTITRKLGESFGLDRCSIFLAERGGRTARLVASYEDPSIRNYVVDLERYPELKRALQSGETVFIPDASADPNLKHIKGTLINRRVQSITVVPITWRGVAIGAIFLRSYRDGPSFSEGDIKFTQVIGSLTAKALRNAYRYERLASRRAHGSEDQARTDRERAALVGFLKRLLDSYAQRDPATGAGEQVAQSSVEELDRLVEIAMTVIAEEGKGR
ncbi:MAG TPA: GAF domain-containing protein [Gemmatimonadales bacterium]|nr:GAF domain-containing protein [Gemmatimonadales bacterium]